ncbi:hypothetical protein G155_00199 [Mycobacterium sp. VKM Ac-1817D]|nr:hypothetical protein G155_00199 [Mycobacterium sp. VKM Ac-1817D]
MQQYTLRSLRAMPGSDSGMTLRVDAAQVAHQPPGLVDPNRDRLRR